MILTKIFYIDVEMDYGPVPTYRKKLKGHRFDLSRSGDRLSVVEARDRVNRINTYKREIDEYWNGVWRAVELLSDNLLLPELSTLITEYSQYSPLEDEYMNNYSYVDANGRKEGPWVQWDFRGRKTKEGQYHEDSKEGLWLIYYPNGNLARREQYRKNKLDGLSTSYWQHFPLTKYSEAEWRNDRRNGIHIVWDEHGNIITSENYLNGALVINDMD